MRSKIDGHPPISCDDLLILRQTRCSKEAVSALQRAPALQVARKRVEEAGCMLFPESANGACLLVPLTDENLHELNLNFEKYHIVALSSDKGAIEEALKSVPRSLRPRLRDDCQALQPDDASGGSAMAASAASISQELAPLHRAQEFVTRNMGAGAPSDISLVAYSAPCGNLDQAQPANPRHTHWHAA